MITELLDAHMQALHDAGYVRTATRPGPDEQTVRRQLRTAGFGDRDDLVEYFCWADYPPAGNGTLGLFWETVDPFSLEEAIPFIQGLEQWTHDPETPGEEYWPGAESWIPIAMQDPKEFISVDSRSDTDGGGAVWFLTTETENLRMFDSLPDAIKTAIYCVEAGLWTMEYEGYAIACPGRDSAPSPGDLTNPPWSGYEPPG